MSLATETTSKDGARDIQLVTFRIGDVLMGINIEPVEEINRLVEATAVPHAPDYVQGVVNLRGDVVTVVDLRTILGLPPVEITRLTRNVIVRSQNERIGLLVDRIGDVIEVRNDEINQPPANLKGLDRRFFTGVYKLESELLVVLDVKAALKVELTVAA